MSDDAILNYYKMTKDHYSEDVIYDDGGVRTDTVVVLTNKDNEKVVMVESYNSGSSILAIGLSDIELNGIVCSTGRYTSGPANAGTHQILYLKLDDIIEYHAKGMDINDVHSVGFKILVYDTEGNKVASEKEVTIDFAEAKGSSGGQEVYNEGGIVFTYMGMNVDEYGYTHLLFYVKNDSGTNIEVDVNNVAVNGMMVDVFDYADVENGKTGALEVEISESDLEDISVSPDGITTLEITAEIENDDYDTIATPIISVPVTQ